MTQQQKESIEFYIQHGFEWDKQLSTSSCAVVIKRWSTYWNKFIFHVYGLDGSISLDHDFSKDLTLKTT